MDDKVFVLYMAFISQDSNVILFGRAHITSLKADEAFTSVSPNYTDFVDIFSKDLKLLEYTKINNYAINLIERHQPSYRSIYSIGLVKLKNWKIYIKINFVNSFI